MYVPRRAPVVATTRDPLTPGVVLREPAAAVIRDFIKTKHEEDMAAEVAALMAYAEMVTTFDSHAAAWGYVNNNFATRSTLVLPRQGVALVRLDSVWRPYVSCLGGLKEWRRGKPQGNKPSKTAQLAVWDLLLICERTKLRVSSQLRQLFRFVCIVVIERFYQQVAAGELKLPKKSPLKTHRPSISADLQEVLDWFTVFALPSAQLSVLRKALVATAESVSVAVIQLLRYTPLSPLPPPPPRLHLGVHVFGLRCGLQALC